MSTEKEGKKSARARMGPLDVLFSFGQALVLLILGSIIIGNPKFYIYEYFYSASLFHAAGIIFVVMGVFRLITLLMMCFGVFSTMETGPAIAVGCPIVLFACLILASLLLFFVGGILILVYHGRVEHGAIKRTMEHYMTEYAAGGRTDDTYTAVHAWDTLQANGQCCGIKGPNDWLDIYGKADQLPGSCCALPNTMRGSTGGNLEVTVYKQVITDCTPATSHQRGCGKWISSITSMALGAGVFAIIFTIIPIITIGLLLLALWNKQQLEEDTYMRIGSKIYKKQRAAPVPTEEPPVTLP